jgi:hypothetical protein
VVHQQGRQSQRVAITPTQASCWQQRRFHWVHAHVDAKCAVFGGGPTPVLRKPSTITAAKKTTTEHMCHRLRKRRFASFRLAHQHDLQQQTRSHYWRHAGIRVHKSRKSFNPRQQRSVPSRSCKPPRKLLHGGVVGVHL